MTYEDPYMVQFLLQATNPFSHTLSKLSTTAACGKKCVLCWCRYLFILKSCIHESTILLNYVQIS